uniref:Uncharacterized protein n=1 Tax=Eutreptiella gymnastica TaxID=73025 RepID=A0A7S1NAB4_9EUGL
MLQRIHRAGLEKTMHCPVQCTMYRVSLRRLVKQLHVPCSVVSCVLHGVINGVFPGVAPCRSPTAFARQSPWLAVLGNDWHEPRTVRHSRPLPNTCAKIQGEDPHFPPPPFSFRLQRLDMQTPAMGCQGPSRQSVRGMVRATYGRDVPSHPQLNLSVRWPEGARSIVTVVPPPSPPLPKPL